MRQTVDLLAIDSDQHLYEPRGMWGEHIDPAHRDWRGTHVELADVHLPGDVRSCGARSSTVL